MRLLSLGRINMSENNKEAALAVIQKIIKGCAETHRIARIFQHNQVFTLAVEAPTDGAESDPPPSAAPIASGNEGGFVPHASSQLEVLRRINSSKKNEK